MNYKLTEMEEELAEIIWENKSIKSGELVSICEEKFEWKKSTTYTMLKRLENKKMFINENSLIRPLVTREDYYALHSEGIVEEKFEGSLPKFLTAFTRRNKLSRKDIEEIESLIEEFKEM